MSTGLRKSKSNPASQMSQVRWTRGVVRLCWPGVVEINLVMNIIWKMVRTILHLQLSQDKSLYLEFNHLNDRYFANLKCVELIQTL